MTDEEINSLVDSIVEAIGMEMDERVPATKWRGSLSTDEADELLRRLRVKIGVVFGGEG